MRIFEELPALAATPPWSITKCLLAPIWIPLYLVGVAVGHIVLLGVMFGFWVTSWIFHGGYSDAERRALGDPTALCDPHRGNPVMDPFMGRCDGSVSNGTDQGSAGI